mmetsp:Transcript_69104/g.183980  ORF Transcript_69104/g.183980 Transcript_69104/m.183980 type:complete len:198 (-) Transcript_69104:303-896(-)
MVSAPLPESKKIVLAVVAINIDSELQFVRGCNLEVSMPSGSLCAERNAIGTALSMYPDVERKDFCGVAVLSLTPAAEGDDNLNPLPPCGVCSEWLEKIQEKNHDFRVVTFSDQNLDWVHVSSLAPVSSALKHIVQRTCSCCDEAERLENEHHMLSSASNVVINPTQATDLRGMKLRNFQVMQSVLSSKRLSVAAERA